MEDDRTEVVAFQLLHHRLEGPHAVQHHGKPPPLGQFELRAEELLLLRERHAAGKVEPDFADGLRPVELTVELVERPAEPPGAGRRDLPRMDARRPKLDAQTRRPMRVDIDPGCSHEGKNTHFPGKLWICKLI